MVPEYCSISHNENNLIIQYPTNYICDNQVVIQQFSINKKDGSLSLNVNGSDIDVVKFGLKPKMEISQDTVDGLTFICDSIKLCQGQHLESGNDSPVVIMKKWNNVLDDPSNIKFKFHSRRCNGVLMFNCAGKTTCCEHCTRDINHTQAYRKLKEETSLSKPSVGIQCETTEKDPNFNPSVVLCEEDNEDFSNMLETICGKAPEFKLLFESQLSNARHKDAHQRRWDPAVISLCINLWAR